MLNDNKPHSATTSRYSVAGAQHAAPLQKRSDYGRFRRRTLQILNYNKPHSATTSRYSVAGAQHAAPLQRRRGESSEVTDDFAGGVGAGGAGEAVAGMRAGAAEKKAADGRFVARPIENGAHGEKLIEREFAVKNVASSETVGCFEIFGRDDLHVFDEIGQVRRVSGESLDDGVPQVIAARVPVPFS